MGRTTAVALALVATASVNAAADRPAAAHPRAIVARPTARNAPPPQHSLLCRLGPGEKKLPADRRHGLIGHLRQYPDPRLASPAERVRAERLLAALVATAAREHWRDRASAEHAGFHVKTVPRQSGDPSVHYVHAERAAVEGPRVVLDPTRPKALIYANAPGSPLVLVGAMWSTRDGEIGPTPGGPITRWHSHMICLAYGKRRGTQVPSSGVCPAGSRLVQGQREMMHVWFTGDLRSAFAISAPEPELCAARLLPHGYCERSATR